jgi:Histidine kinase-, DNA gyrase B-, and HSP90-like ATPase.
MFFRTTEINTLSNKIRHDIKTRIYIALLLTSLLPIILAFYSYSNAVNTLKKEAFLETKKLGDYIIGQYLVNNQEAVLLKIKSFNQIHDYKVNWIKNLKIERQDFKINFGKFTIKYPLHLISNINNTNLGSFIVEGKLSTQKILTNSLIEIIIITFSFAFLLYLLLIPLATQIPQRLILEPIQHLISILEKDGINEHSNNEHPLYEEIHKIELQFRELISLVKTQSKDAAIGILTKKLVHDIKSPLAVIQACEGNLKKTNIDKQLIKSLDAAINNIKHILMNLLKINVADNFKPHNDSDNPRYILLKSILEEIVNHKTIEWHYYSCKIVYEDNTPIYNIWLKILPYDFINNISNLLNNAYESTDGIKKDGLIKLRMSEDISSIIIEIIDNGCGMAANILPEVMKGYSTKKNGQGIGLSSAIYYIQSIGGNLSIESAENKGTIVKITLPKIHEPTWFSKKINIEDHVVILDDDTSTHYYLQSVLYDKAEIKLFTKVNDFKLWIAENNMLNKVTYFIDNQIEDQYETGIELIEKYHLEPNSYLITNEYDSYHIQKKATKMNLKVLPKPLLQTVFENHS